MREETLTWFNKLSLLVMINITDMQVLNFKSMYLIELVIE